MIKKLAKLMLLLLLCISGMFTMWKVTFLLKPILENKRCGCEKCVSDHQHWFMQRFQKNIPPFMTRNYNLSQEDFRWWTNLYCRSCNMTYFKQVKQRVFEFFPGGPPVGEADPQRCRTCAVVGNSRNLRKSHYGRLIDLHDFVFRINFGRTKGFEEDVGTRTTHRVMYPDSSTDLDNKTHVVFFSYKMKDLEWILRAPKALDRSEWSRVVWIKKPRRLNKNLIMFLNPAFMKYVHQSWLQKKGWYPSTGFLSVVLALHMCDQVSVFGFGVDIDGNWSHYFEKGSFKNLKTGFHPGSLEYDTIEELGKRGKLTFYTGM